MSTGARKPHVGQPTAMRSSMRVGGLCGGVTVNWTRVPSTTPAGTVTWRSCWSTLGAAPRAPLARFGPALAAAAAPAARAAHRHRQRHRDAVERIPRRQLNRRAATASCRSSARNALRIRSTAGATDGKSTMTSSAKQLDVVAAGVARARRRRSPPKGRNMCPRIRLLVR